MEFKEFCKERKRMCDTTDNFECNLYYCLPASCLACKNYCIEHPDEAEKIVSRWSKEHPIMTNGDKFYGMLCDTFSKDTRISFEHTNDKCIIRVDESWWDSEYHPPQK